MQKKLRASAAAIAALFLLASCGAGSGDDTGAPAEGGTEAATEGGADAATFRIGTVGAPETLNPLMGHEAEGATWFYDGLVRLVGEELEPALAQEMPEPNADATQWTLTLRPDVTFSDGSTLDAADVVATYERIMDPSAASPWASELAGLTEVVATSDDTLQFTLDAPNAFFGDRLTVGIVPSEIAEDEQGQPLTESSLNDTPVGTGPYLLESWADRNDLVLQARDDWWRGEPGVKQIIVTAVPNDTLRTQMVLDGALDGAMISGDEAHSLLPEGQRDGAIADDPGLTVVVNDTADVRAISLPMANPITADPVARQAMNLAVDRQGMVDGVLHGYAIAIDNPFPHSVGVYEQPAVFKHDPETAKQLLDDAGWLEGPNGVRFLDEVPASITLMYPSSDTQRRDLAQVVADQFRVIGIDARPEALSWDLIEQRMSADALVFAGGTAGNPDATAWNWMACELAGEGFNNPGHYCNEELDHALVAGRSTTDVAAQQDAYAQANEIFAEDPGYVYLNTISRTYLLRPGDWQGIEPHTEGHVHTVSWGPWWNIAEWTS